MSFTLPEIFSLLGLTQCVYLLVHIVFGSRQFKAIFLPVLYFAVLGMAFWADAMGAHMDLLSGALYYMQWAGWYMGPPLSVLLVMQISHPDRMPSVKDFWILLLLPLSFMLSALALDPKLSCSLSKPCEEFKDLLAVMGLMAGTISLLVIFSKKNLFKNIKKQKFGAERYWLILSLIILNTLFLGAIFAFLTHLVTADDIVLLRTIFGLGFVYLVSTSLLRIIPSAPKAQVQDDSATEALSDADKIVARKIEGLLDLEKVYHEPTYARSDLARECGVSEMVVSRVINTHFQKSFPQIMNERRIEDAKRLLVETQAAVKTVAQEVGFNSLPSFNRVFKEQVGEAPGEYRKNHQA